MSTFDPVVRVEAAWGFTPFDDVTDGSFQEIAEFKSGQWGRGGRSSPIDVYGAGTASFQFHDLNRTLDPLNTSSSLNGELVPDVPVRVVAEYSSTDYPLWFGYIDDYDTLFHVGLGDVTIPATDGLRVLQGITLTAPLDVIVEVGAGAWWTFDELGSGDALADRIGDITINAITAASLAAGLAPNSSGSIELPGYTGPGFSVSHRDLFGRDATLQGLFAGTAWSVSLWVKFASPLTSAAALDFNIVWLEEDFTGVLCYLSVDSAGLPTVDIDGASLTASQRIDDSLAHHIVWGRNGNDAFMYIDGVSAGTATGSPVSFTILDQISAGYVPLLTTETFPAWQIDELVVYPGVVLSSGDVSDIYDAYSSFSGNVTTGERLTELFDYAELPATMRAFDPGEVYVGPTDVGGQSVLDVVNQIVQTEGGRFFQGKNGDFTFHDAGRFQRETVETTSQVTFSDTTDGVLYERGIRFRKGFHDVIDRMDVTRVGGIVQTAKAVANPLQGRTLSTLHATDVQASYLAERIVVLHGTAGTRVDGWSCQPQLDGPAFWADLLGLELGDRVTVTGTPLDQGSTVTLEQHLDSIGCEVGATFRMKFTGQRVDEADHFQWGGSPGSTYGWGAGTWR